MTNVNYLSIRRYKDSDRSDFGLPLFLQISTVGPEVQNIDAQRSPGHKCVSKRTSYWHLLVTVLRVHGQRQPHMQFRCSVEKIKTPDRDKDTICRLTHALFTLSLIY